MIDRVERRFLSVFLAILMIVSLLPVQAFAAGSRTDSGSIEGSNISWSASIPTKSDGRTALGSAVVEGTTMTITVAPEPSYDDCSKKWSYNQTSVTVTFTNTHETAEAVIGFDYIPGNKVEIAGTEYTVAGSYMSANVAPNKTLTVKFYSTENGNDGTGESVTLTLSNIKWTENTIRPMTVKPGTNGTVSVAGTAITADSTQDVAYATGLAVSASPASGYKFLAWVDGNNNVMATTASATIKPEQDNIVVSALFVPTSENGHWIGNKKIFTEFQNALDAAAAGDKSVKLMDNATLTQNYTIPAGVSVLIPFDQALTAYGNNPLVVERPSSGPPTPKVYCTLTMAAGVTLTVKGSLEVGAKHVAAHGGQLDGGRVWEYYAHVTMGAGSHIDVKSGGALYAWGHVTGSGRVTANSGATIYEKFQITDYRGGGVTSIIVPLGVFPFNQYYVQNVEVPETICAGATLIGHAGMYMSELMSAPINFIGGNDAMFAISSGNVTKRYDNASDRLIIDLNGQVSMNPISLMDYNTANFILPVNHNITVNINSGMMNMNQDLMLQPGAEVNVARNAYVMLANGKKVYLMDTENWGNYCFGEKLRPLPWVPLKNAAPGIRTADNMTDARININGTMIVQGQAYASSAGALIESVGKTGVVILMNNAPSGTTNIRQSPIVESKDVLNATKNISVGAVKLTNADRTTVDTKSATQYTTYVYDTILDRWVTTGITIAPTLTYNANGGDGADVTETINFQNTALAFQPLSVAVKGSDTFTREGYTLTGWNTAADGSGKAFEVGDYITISADTTLYAVWEAGSFALYLDGNTDGDVEFGTDLSTVLDNDLRYFEFYKDANKTEPVDVSDGKMPAHALYVFSKPTYKLVLDGTDKADGLLAGDTFRAALGEGSFRFYSDAACTQVVEITSDAMPAHDLYAKTLYTLTFQNEKGEVIQSGQFVAGETINAPAYTAPEGSTFTGWWNDTEGVEITFPATMPVKDLVITPVNKTNYVVALNVNGEEYATYEATARNNYTITITVADPTKENATFLGWHDGNGNYYKQGDTISNVSVDMTLEAVFCTHENTNCVDNDDGTHDIICTNTACKAVVADNQGHSYTDGVCACKAVKSYTITWIVNGKETTTTVKHGDVPTFSGSTDKAQEGCTTYTFNGWDNEPVAATEDTTYTATYTEGESHTPGAAADCENDQTCTVCGALIEAAKGHQPGAAADCENDQTCTVCGALIEAAKGHSFTNYVSDENATCTEDGTKTAKCDRCDATDTVKDEGSAQGHQPGAAADCENDQTCTVCGALIEAAKGHTYIEGKCGCGAVYSGIASENGDLYYYENGVAGANKGLVRVYENGKVKYYYFGCAQTDCDSHEDNSCDPYKAQKDCVHWVENNNDLLPKWDYIFGADGAIACDDALNNNETQNHQIVTYDGVKFYTIDGIKAPMGMVEIDGDYYYVRSSGELVCGKIYWATNVNNTGFAEDLYAFDEEGKMIRTNGIMEENGALFYYENGIRTYAGLIQIDGNWYYVRTSGQLATGTYWITKTNGLMAEGSYTFDEDGKMINPAPLDPDMDGKNGIVEEHGKLYYYVDGERSYAGLIEIDGDYYYVRTSGQLATGTYWITKTNGMLEQGVYYFAEDGKMIRTTGIVEEADGLYYYENGVRNYAGLIEIDGNWYYVRTSGQLATGTYWITKTNGWMPEGSYTFDEYGVMQNPVE